MTVNHGAPVHTVRVGVENWTGWRVEHDGPDGHDQLQPGEQCACGVLEIGVIR